MRPPGKQRLAQRHEIETTPIHWKVPKRGRKRVHLVEAAVVEVSVMGAAIVAPNRYEVPIGARVELFWQDQAAWVLVRHSAPYRGSDGLVLYGVEYIDARAKLGPAMYEELVLRPQEEAAAARAAAVAERMATPVVWAKPRDWVSEG